MDLCNIVIMADALETSSREFGLSVSPAYPIVCVPPVLWLVFSKVVCCGTCGSAWQVRKAMGSVRRALMVEVCVLSFHALAILGGRQWSGSFVVRWPVAGRPAATIKKHCLAPRIIGSGVLDVFAVIVVMT